MKDYQFFPTPPETALLAAQKADIRPGHRLLEPSAGTGTLLRRAVEFNPSELLAVERDHWRYLSLRKQLPGRFGWDVMCCDFLLMRWPERERFDRVLMNPPFNPALDVTHVLHAFDHALKSGGLLTAIITPRFRTSRSKESVRLRELMLRVRGANGIVELPENHAPGATRDTVLIQLLKP